MDLRNVTMQSNIIETIPVLDNGFIELLGIFGDELTIVNSARVSFGTEKTKLSDGDVKLMNYLRDNKHFSPFRHLMFRFKIKAPEFVMRQLYKHVVGIEATSSCCIKDHAWNELSGRYKKIESFYTPESWRKQSKDSKQASEGKVEGDVEKDCQKTYNDCMSNILESYNKLLELGVAKEEARIILPLSMYSEVIWTCSFQAIANFIELRDHEHSQWEIREYATVFKEIIKKYLPITYSVWFE